MTLNIRDIFGRFKIESNLNFRKTSRCEVRDSHNGVQITVSYGMKPCSLTRMCHRSSRSLSPPASFFYP